MPWSRHWPFHKKRNDKSGDSEISADEELRQQSRNKTISQEQPESLKSKEELCDPPPFGIKVLVDRPEDAEGQVDIVAIHGLNGHREETWTDHTTKLNWLSDKQCLSKDIPHARVLTFGYNSKTYFSRSSSDVRDFASELLAGLQAIRNTRAQKQRAIVFVCHSLGGLVFKQAVIRAHERKVFYGNIVDNIRGVVFFGTPHRGSDLAFWDRIGTSLLRTGTLGYLSNSKLSKDLMLNAEMLKNISESFTSRGGDFGIRSFYETERMPGLNCRVVEQHSSVLGLPNELDIASSAHHSNICKFPTSSDARYRTAMFALMDLIEGARDDESDDYVFTSQEEACMRNLNSDYEDHLKQVDDPISGTCTWVLQHKKWIKWESLEVSALLWITADAGCGKSVIAKFLVSNLQDQPSGVRRRQVCHFFFKEGLDGQNNADLAVSALLHQLCSSRRRLIKYVSPKFASLPKKSFTKFSSLWSIVMRILQEYKGDLVWILDGIDECNSKSLDELIKALNFYLKSSLGKMCQHRFKIIILSRPRNIIHQKLQLGMDEELEERGRPDQYNMMRLAVEDEAAAVAGDISLFVRCKVRDLGKQNFLSDEALLHLKAKLISNADFTFLWISLVTQLVEEAGIDGVSSLELQAILNTTELDDLYERLLAGRTQPLKTKKVLLLVLAASRPLSVKEMCVALEIRQDHILDLGNIEMARQQLAELGTAEYDRAAPSQFKEAAKVNRSNLTRLLQDNKQGAPSNVQGLRAPSNADKNAVIPSLYDLEKALHRPPTNHLRQLCGNFIRIRHNRIYLVHQTARNFLLKEGGREPHISRNQPSLTAPLGSWRHSIQLEDANRYILQICSDYINLFLPEWSSKDIQWSEEEVDQFLKECRRDPPCAFFRYTATHWVDHYRPLRKTLRDFSYDNLLTPRDPRFKIWMIVHLGWVTEEERNKLETGGITVSGKKGDLNEDTTSSDKGWKSSYHSKLRRQDKDEGALQEVLEFFDLGLFEETEEYDETFLSGDRYWKRHIERHGSGEEHEGVHYAGRLPDRVKYFRRQHRNKYLDDLEEFSNPLSPTGGNPTSRNSVRTDWAAYI